jgi:probable phosphoglycerate mutase
VARLLLVRHAATPETGKRLTGRLPGVGISPRGAAQAEATARLLAELPIAAVYTSPLRRCRETARIISAPHGLDPVQYRSLIEVDYGSWSGRTLASLRRTKAWRALLSTPSRVTFPGGERLGEVQARGVAACEDLAAGHKDATIVLVSHGDVIKAILAHYLGVPFDLFQRISVDPASVSEIHLPAAGFPRVLRVNHLEEWP